MLNRLNTRIYGPFDYFQVDNIVSEKFLFNMGVQISLYISFRIFTRLLIKIEG